MPKTAYLLINSVKVRLFYLVRRLLTQRSRNAIKQSLALFRKRWSGIYLLLNGRYNAKELVEQVRSRIPADFDILMVHSSYDRMLPMYSGKPQELLDELIALCGTNRTLAMPAFFFGGRQYDSAGYYRSHPFDATRTMSQMGLLTEIFRRLPGVRRSLHPTHSVCALGPLADALTGTHHFASTRTGKGTPFDVMVRNKTAIVGLGVEYFRSLTQTHTAEDLLGDEFPVRFEKETIPMTLIDRKGKKLRYDLSILKSSKILDNSLVGSLLQDGELVQWKFKGTPLYITFADKVTTRLVDAAKKGITVYRSA